MNIAKALIGKREIETKIDRHPARREDARDHGLGGGGAPLRARAATTTPSCRCCPSCAERTKEKRGALSAEFSSADNVLDFKGTEALLRQHRLMIDDVNPAKLVRAAALSTVVVTGATGFVGRHLCPALAAAGHEARPADPRVPDSVEDALSGADAVVHLAARVHVMQRHGGRSARRVPPREHRGDARARRAPRLREGVRRFVFLSSIKVNGERTEGRPFTERDAPAPVDPYARFKVGSGAGSGAMLGALDLVVLRPPLVYGPAVKGNFLRLMKLVARGVPLPLAGVANRRSLIYVGNLASAIERAVRAERAVQGPLLVSDGEDLSTAQLVRRLGDAMGTARAPLHSAARAASRARTRARQGRRSESDDRIAARRLFGSQARTPMGNPLHRRAGPPARPPTGSCGRAPPPERVTGSSSATPAPSAAAAPSSRSSTSATSRSRAAFSSRHSSPTEPRYRLRVVFCTDCLALQLPDVVDPAALFANYFYFSSAIRSLREHFLDYASEVVARFLRPEHATVVEIGCNDGILLKPLADHGVRTPIGVDPATNIVQSIGDPRITVVNDFFGSAVAARIRDKHGAADLIVANNVYAHIPDINDVTTRRGRAARAQRRVRIRGAPPRQRAAGPAVRHDLPRAPLLLLAARAGEPSASARPAGVRRQAHSRSTPARCGTTSAARAAAGRRASPTASALLRQDELAQGLDRVETFQHFAAEIAQRKDTLMSYLERLRKAAQACRRLRRLRTRQHDHPVLRHRPRAHGVHDRRRAGEMGLLHARLAFRDPLRPRRCRRDAPDVPADLRLGLPERDRREVQAVPGPRRAPAHAAAGSPPR